MPPPGEEPPLFRRAAAPSIVAPLVAWMVYPPNWLRPVLSDASPPVTVTVPAAMYAPPTMVATLFVRTVFVRVTAPGPRAIRPPTVLAALPSNVEPDTTNDEKLMASRPPPSIARLFV